MKWNENLPDTSTWQPKAETKATDTIQRSLVAACEAAQQRIIQEGRIERGFNINNFDSGPGLEDITREELRKLIPSRYEISPGVVKIPTPMMFPITRRMHVTSPSCLVNCFMVF